MFELPPIDSPTFPGIIDEPGTGGSTAPALVAYAFFGLQAPASARLDSLLQFSEAQLASYKAQGVARAELGPFEAFGRALVHEGNFEQRYNALSNNDFIVRAYSDIFERPATQSQISHFVAQITYFRDLYTGTGLAAQESTLLAKGAVAGQMLGFAVLDENAKMPTTPTGFDFF
jgi:hypothetical protein